MDLITLDFESFYSTEFTLSKLTTEEYIRHRDFETIMCGFKINAGQTYWVDGPDVAAELAKLRIAENAVLCHHAHFDGLILSHHYGQYPKVWFDTLSMARAALGQKVPMGLAALAKRFGLGQKGEEVIMAKGKRRRDFSGSEIKRYGEYCCNDIDLTYDLFHRLLPAIPKGELKIIDMVIRMFTEPTLHLDTQLLEEYIQDIRADKTGALLQAGIQLADVMSNDKFAAALEQLGVMPPTKISPTTGKETYAFAKTDNAMEALAEHPDDRVQALVAARLKNKTTIAESRAIRMAGMGLRGAAPVYLKYSGAEQTHRLSGGDKMNWQNMGRGSKLRDSVVAGPGDIICVGDSSNIESRLLDWLAGQNDVVQVYRDADNKVGPDVYCVMAEKIYNRPINKADDPDERQLGKVAKLGLGYGMGGAKFVQAVRVMAKKKITEADAKLIVSVYRESHPMVTQLWKRAEEALGYILKGVEGKPVDFRGVVTTSKQGLRLPNGLEIKYPDLQFKEGRGEDAGYSYFDGRVRTKVYGGKVVENCLADGTEVLTARGWVPIERVRTGDLVYDGVDFVQHGGVVFKSTQPCTAIDGVYMTLNHEVLTDEGWKPALEKPEPRRADVWEPDCATYGRIGRAEDALGVQMPVWHAGDEGRSRRDEGAETWGNPELRVPKQAAGSGEEPHAWHVEAPGILGVAVDAGSVLAADPSGVPQLWGARHPCLRSVEHVRPVLEGYGADLPVGAYVGASGQLTGVLQGELCVGHSPSPVAEQTEQPDTGHPCVSCEVGGAEVDTVLPLVPRSVYDILNCGPRARFVVRGNHGPFIVHNCIQALARIVVMDQTLAISQYLPVVLSVHDEVVAVTAEDDGKDATAFMLEQMRKPPEWGLDMPLNSEGGYHRSYGKAKK